MCSVIFTTVKPCIVRFRINKYPVLRSVISSNGDGFIDSARLILRLATLSIVNLPVSIFLES